MKNDPTDAECVSNRGAISLSVLHCPFEILHWPSAPGGTQ